MTQYINNHLLNTPQKRIIFDIDDTLSYTISRDWENATPNEPLIQKINKLFSDGWEIFLITARGSISCATREEAYEKYGAQLISWLNRHNVHYHLLSFNKQLATYYVDDKGITPEDFLNLNMKVIKEGWSGALVELRGDKIYKTHKNSKDVSLWYQMAKNYVNVPQIHSLIGDTICMEYLDANTDVRTYDLIDVIKQFATMPKPNPESNFGNYLDRIKDHCQNEDFDLSNVWLILKNKFIDEKHPFISNISWCDYLNKGRCDSFCHGDFSIDNVISSNGKLYLIDPIYETSRPSWNSWLLDLSKLLMSLNKNNKTYMYNHIHQLVFKTGICNNILPKSLQINDNNNKLENLVNLLECTQWIRVLKYAPKEEQEDIYNKINEIVNLY